MGWGRESEVWSIVCLGFGVELGAGVGERNRKRLCSAVWLWGIVPCCACEASEAVGTCFADSSCSTSAGVAAEYVAEAFTGVTFFAAPKPKRLDSVLCMTFSLA